ncbi:MAG: hypothetical protein KAW14_09045 [Candidatus Aegiribacteria sp.]|nr:hypothetical protein [Candidatus Aegiribacteria sp.]
MLSMVITIKELDECGKHTYTKVCKNRGYVESTYQGGSIIKKYDMNEYRNKLSSLNLVQENHIPYMTGWVKHYLALGNPDDAVFADILYREGREDWQIRQALDAVKIYRGLYPEDSATVKENSAEHLQIMRDSLKVC